MGREDAQQNQLMSEKTMETNVKYTLAGTFVLGMLGLIIFSIIWLSSGLSTEDYSYYTVYMKESVSGLNKDGPIEFNGVQVGTIDNMTIDSANPQVVKLLLKVKSDTPITMGTKAKLGIRALSGNAYLLLEDKGTDKKPLVSQNGEPPVIPTTPSILVRLDTILNQMSESFQQISSSIRSLLSKENLQSIRLLLQKVSK